MGRTGLSRSRDARRRALWCALALCSLSIAGTAHAQQPLAPPSAAPAPSTPQPNAWNPPAPAWTPGAPPGYGPVIVMPPGFLEWPGRWPRRVAVDRDDGPPPLGYHHATEPPKALWISGTVIFAVSHGISALLGGGFLAANGDEEHGLLFLPVLGPVVWAPVVAPDSEALIGVMTGVTVVQGVGLGLLISGLALRRPIHLRNDVVSATDPQASVSVGPGGATFGLEF